MTETCTNISCNDRIAEIREELMLISIFLRGVLDILDNESPAIYSVLREHAEETERKYYKAIVTSIYYIDQQLNAIEWPF